MNYDFLGNGSMKLILKAILPKESALIWKGTHGVISSSFSVIFKLYAF